MKGERKKVKSFFLKIGLFIVIACIWTACKDDVKGAGEAVLDELIQRSGIHEAKTEGVVVTNLRHYEALRNALSAIDRVRDGLQENLSGDLLSRDIRDCLFFLAEITGGEITNDEVLGNIFAKFCVGK